MDNPPRNSNSLKSILDSLIKRVADGNDLNESIGVAADVYHLSPFEIEYLRQEFEARMTKTETTHENE